VRRAPAIALALLALAARPAAATPGTVVATGVPLPTNVAFDPRGGMWITSGTTVESLPTDGVWYVAGPGAPAVQVVRGLRAPLGLVWRRGALYVASTVSFTTGRVTAYRGFDGRRFARSRVVVPYVPAGRFSPDSLARGPDGRMYLGVGSDRDHQRSGHGDSGTVVSFDPRLGGALRIEARGLRDPYGVAFVPGTRTLLVTDDGRDDLGRLRAPEELNVVPDVGGPAPDFGFPDCWGQGGASCAGMTSALVRFPAHASTAGLAVARHWPGAPGPVAFVAENGSSRQDLGVGDDVRRIDLRRTPAGRWVAVKRGRLTGFAHRDPLGAAIGPDGGLYVTLLLSGQVVRLTTAELG
jgi:glucose/arabinose dehydrogenase